MGDAARVQQTDTETPIARLRMALARLGEDGATLTRDMRRTARGRDQAVDIIVAEIDETVLPRHIEIVAEDGPVVASFIASNRRLIEISPPAQAEINQKGDITDPEEAAQQHVKTIRTLADRGGRLRLTPAGRARNPGTGGTSCSTRSLLRAGRALGQEARMTRLLDRIAPHAEAWLCDHEDGGQARRHGSDTVLKTLAALDAALVGTDRRRGPAERLERKGPDCSVFAMGAGVQAVVAREGRARLVASVRQAEVANVLAIWTALFGAPGQGAPIAE